MIVLKYAFRVRGFDVTRLDLELPVGSRPVLFAIQEGRPTLWFLLDQERREKTSRSFVVIGTGHTFTGPVDFFASAMTPDGSLVLHCFEVSPT